MKNYLLLIEYFITLVASQGTIAWPFQPNYLNNGEDWRTTYNSCKGQMQSPIDLSRTPISTLPQKDLELEIFLVNKWVTNHYTYDNCVNFTGHISDLSFVNENHEKVEFEGVYMEIHAPGQHTINGTLSDAEVNIVYKKIDKNGKIIDPPIYAIVAIPYLLTEKEESPLFKALNLDQRLGYTRINLYESLFPDFNQSGFNYFSYDGSLTFPDCTENVRWFVFQEASFVSIRQFGNLISHFADNITFANGMGNNRITQNLNGRAVYFMKFNRSHSFGTAHFTCILISLSMVVLFH